LTLKVSKKAPDLLAKQKKNSASQADSKQPQSLLPTLQSFQSTSLPTGKARLTDIWSSSPKKELTDGIVSRTFA